MLISKSYLKQIIKEETQKILNKETVIQMSPSDYLNLTTNQVHFPLTDIIKRYEFRVKKIAERLKEEGIDNDKAISMAKQEIAIGLEQAKMPALVINKDGKVVDHEGRLRSYYYGFIQQPKKEKIPVTLIHPANLEVSSPYLILKNQFDDTETPVTIKNPDYLEQKQEAIELKNLIDVKMKKDDLSIKLRQIASSMKDPSNPLLTIEKLNNLLNGHEVIKSNNPEHKYDISLTSIGVYGSAKYKKMPDTPELSWNDIIILRKK